ncbi:hypothetical protein [Flavobacterium sp. GT3R68]|uniref:hypothetical protein n=1 Tax=Flavobacterium sp. GT3R68 TaxID=2594437 RepID=UPI000F8899B1|nr:hypothetical protein [Flavobacterium sp. GT3R68]RTY92409.1 hypothetical protein EKL32_17550 [Flavobacterium sp. GSN2]TRW92325.1 hypothetical protein FNW07_04765 [Flavobacterium sp. GT3R68]
MPHLIARLQNVPIETIREILERDKAFHNQNNMFLEHLWQNADNQNEVQFLFKIDTIEVTRTLINKLHSEALAQDAHANLPEMTYLE